MAVGRRVPTRWISLVFAGKVWGLRVKRFWDDRDASLRRFPAAIGDSSEWPVGPSIASDLWVSEDPRERRFELGKVQNLRVACAAIHGVVLEAGDVFSFWKQVGRTGRRRGFAVGRMLQEGCVIPAVGGGLCQLSNALYGLALMSQSEIVERHPHSVRMPNAPVHDATVAWNYVDLRFRVRQRTRIVATMNAETLTVGFRFKHALANGLTALPRLDSDRRQLAESCGSCNEVDCFRHEHR